MLKQGIEIFDPLTVPIRGHISPRLQAKGSYYLRRPSDGDGLALIWDECTQQIRFESTPDLGSEVPQEGFDGSDGGAH